MIRQLTITIFLLCLAVSSFADNILVSGVVVSAEDNLPVIGATIVSKQDPTVGTVTDFDGRFSKEFPSNTKQVEISYIGYTTQVVKAKTNLKIVLESETEQIQEVVVTGMQKMDKRLFTGATTKIGADQAKLDGVPDVARALEGKAAGVSVQNVSGTFGTAPKIRVRGATSIYGSSKPLWVVDGIVIEDAVEVSSDQLSSGDAITLISSAIAGLSADDIESFQILKDGSATSIYGARAMAGVVVVTTKRGKVGSQSISYTGELSTRLKPNYANFNISNSQEQMGIYKEMEQKGWLEVASIFNNRNSGVYGHMYQLMAEMENGEYTLSQRESAKNDFLRAAEFRNTDWFDLLFDYSLTQNHSVSISSGTEKAQTYASISVMTDPGWTKSSSVSRYTANANTSYNITKDLRVTLLTNGSYRKQKAPGTTSQEVDVVSGEVARGFDINPYSFALNSSRTMDPTAMYTRNYAPFNIFTELDNNYMDINVQDFRFQGELSWKPLRGLELTALGALRYQSSKNEHHVKDRSNQANAFRAGIFPENATIREMNPYLYTDPDDQNALPETILPEGGIYYLNEYSVRQVDFRSTASYVNSFNDDTHVINLFGGVESNMLDRNATYFQGWGFLYDNGSIPSINHEVFKQQKEENSNYYSNAWAYSRSLAYFASGTYSYKSKYVLNLTGRYEGTNKLGKARSARWLPTYNIALAWNMHEEEWFPTSEAFTHLTLKGSYSLTGDRGPAFVTNAQAVINSFTPWRPTTGDSEAGSYLEDIQNSELTYEKKHEYNFGLDAGFFDYRLNVAVDVYKRNNFDLIGIAYTPGLGGKISKYANVASMKSHGIEATISTQNIRLPKFSWTTDLTFSKTKNEITNLDTRSRMIDLVAGSGFALEGYPVRSLFSIPFEGLNDEGLPTFTNENGQLTVSNINFQEMENLDNLVYEGPTDPTITGGFGNIFTYAGFRLNVFITYSFGNKVRLDPVFRSSYSDVVAMPREFKNRWVAPGEELYTDIPTIADRRQVANDSQLSYAYNAYNYSTARIADGGFIRMKEMSLTYSFPRRLLDAISIKRLDLKVQGTNLFLLYADKKLNGQDPEFFNSGGVATPMPKQLTFTLRLGI